MAPLTDANAIAANDRAEKRSLIGLYLVLAMARLSALVVLTTAAGYVMATPAGPRPPYRPAA